MPAGRKAKQHTAGLGPQPARGVGLAAVKEGDKGGGLLANTKACGRCSACVGDPELPCTIASVPPVGLRATGDGAKRARAQDEASGDVGRQKAGPGDGGRQDGPLTLSSSSDSENEPIGDPKRRMAAAAVAASMARVDSAAARSAAAATALKKTANTMAPATAAGLAGAAPAATQKLSAAAKTGAGNKPASNSAFNKRAAGDPAGVQAAPRLPSLSLDRAAGGLDPAPSPAAMAAAADAVSIALRNLCGLHRAKTPRIYLEFGSFAPPEDLLQAQASGLTGAAPATTVRNPAPASSAAPLAWVEPEDMCCFNTLQAALTTAGRLGAWEAVEFLYESPSIPPRPASSPEPAWTYQRGRRRQPQPPPAAAPALARPAISAHTSSYSHVCGGHTRASLPRVGLARRRRCQLQPAWKSSGHRGRRPPTLWRLFTDWASGELVKTPIDGAEPGALTPCAAPPTCWTCDACRICTA